MREPLRAEHIKPRLLGHWGTSPGLNLVYVHLNRLIRAHDANVIYLAGPGHGGPAMLANVYLEGTYSEIYPEVTRDDEGLRRLFRQFSTPGGVPSHVGPPTPGSIHEGGELGYVLTHAFGAAFDNPDLIVVAVVGDGEAETGPLEGSWKGISFLNPARDGAVLPILHLNGYKIAGPTVLGRAADDAIRSLLAGHGYDVHFVSGDDPAARPSATSRRRSTRCVAKIRAIQRDARAHGVQRDAALAGDRPAHAEGLDRARRSSTACRSRARSARTRCRSPNVTTNPEHLAMLEAWMKSYRPEELFDDRGRLMQALAELAPKGDRRMGANPHANGGTLLVPLELPDFTTYASRCRAARRGRHEVDARARRDAARHLRPNPTNFRLFCPDETNSNRLGAVFEVETRCFEEPTIAIDDHVSPDGRVMEVLSEHNCQGWLEGYLLTGAARPLRDLRGLRADRRVDGDAAREVARDVARACRGARRCRRSTTCSRRPAGATTTTASAIRGPGFMDTIISKKGTVARVYLPPDANCLLSVADHCLRSRNYVNLIIIDKQPQLQWLDIDAARDHCARGASIWPWAGTAGDGEPDVVLACAGDVPTLETVAAAAWLREHAPSCACAWSTSST